MIDKQTLLALDASDPLAEFRHEFDLPSEVIYLDGNSLGAKPKLVEKRLAEVVSSQWGQGLVRSWNEAGWFSLPTTLGMKIAKLVGAEPHEVVVTDATGINLFKAVACAMQVNNNRRVILTEDDNFPTNRYTLHGLTELLNFGFQQKYEIHAVPRQQIAQAVTEDVAAVCLTHVHYQTGHLLDMTQITHIIHEKGALAVWDLSHSTGVLPVQLNRCEVDFAVGCTYKYLNGGPGSPAYIFVAQRHQNNVQQPLTGWWSHADPFAFVQQYQPKQGIEQMLTGTQPILSLAMAQVGIDIALRADQAQVREKSMQLGDHFIELIEQRCAGFGFEIASPRQATARASQVSLRHEHGYPIMQALIDNGVIGDFRAPDVLRFGFAPLYVSYIDIWHAVDKLLEVMQTARWRHTKYQSRKSVT